MRYKTPRIQKEYAYDIVPDMRFILIDLDEYTRAEFNREITLTCLNRTKEENEQDGGVPLSAHLFGRAADIRASTFSLQDMDKIKAYLAKHYPNVHYVYHDAGSGYHIHVNIKYKP